MKPRYKRRLFWTTVSVFAAAALAWVLIPPFINLNRLRPRIEATIIEQTGISAKINGGINFSLLGGTTIVVHNVTIPNGKIDNILFHLPFSKIFNLESADLSDKISISGARLSVDSLIPPKFANKIELRDTIVTFHGKDYDIINGTLSNGMLTGIVRTNQHKYEFDSNGDEFHIKNRANNLNISGNLYSNGTAHGTLSIDTNNINEFFEFDEPRIRGRVSLNMDFDWNGGYGFMFSNILGKWNNSDFDADITLSEDGMRDIKITATDIDMDISFLLRGSNFFHNTKFSGSFSGKIKLADKVFNTVAATVEGRGSEIIITNVLADDLNISGGKISPRGAEDLGINLIYNNLPTYCLFSGTPDTWKCTEFKHGDYTGSLSVKNNIFEVFVQSNKKLSGKPDFVPQLKLLGDKGRINFQFADVGGSVDINKTDVKPSYTFANNKTLEWLGADLHFLPDTMRNAIGNFTWNETGLLFTPHSKRWKLSISKNYFYISGEHAKDWLPKTNLHSVEDFPYTVSGNFNGNSISNLEIKIAGHTFRGTAIDNNLTLTTELLNIDTFTNQNYVDNYEELQFLTADPLTIPFGLGVNVSLSADIIIYNGNDFKNFVYSLRNNTQMFSITDTSRGNLLAKITKDQNKYNATLQLNRFVIKENLLTAAMPLNIGNTTITGEMELSTSGQIAYDIWYNLRGNLDLSFDGGFIDGFGIDAFYANANNITKLNGELMLANALDGGVTSIKNLRIIGLYDGGNFITTEPFILSMKHVDARGNMQISDGRMVVNMALILRGTSAAPTPIEMEILPNSGRNYSLSQIMIDFDPDFFRDFVTTHDKF